MQRLEIGNYFISYPMLNLIVENTNKFIDSIAQNSPRVSNVRQTNKIEIQALLGQLNYSGILKANHLNTDELWATDGSDWTFFV